MATVKKEDLYNFLNVCESLEERGFSEHGVAHAVGFNNTAEYRAFRAIVEWNLEAMEVFRVTVEKILEAMEE